jgi:hypothetical protein
MWTAASVVVCALSILGRAESSMPRIELIDVPPPEVSAGAEAFVRSGTKTIYLITSSRTFQEALASDSHCGLQSLPFRKLASILAHEEFHVRNGSDEKRAYEYQLITLIRLGLPPGTSIYRDVQTSMLRVLAHRKRNQPDALLAQR